MPAIGTTSSKSAAGSNYGILYAIAKGSGGLYRGVLSVILITQHRYPVAMGVAAAMAVCAGLLIVPLRGNPPTWHGQKFMPAGHAMA